MTAVTSAITIAPTQVPSGTSTRAHQRQQADARASDSVASSFQSVLGAIGFALGESAGQVLGAEAALDDVPAQEIGGDLQISLRADAGPDVSRMPVWPDSLLAPQMPAPTPVPTSDARDLGSSTGVLLGAPRPAPRGDATMPRPPARDASAAGTADRADAAQLAPEAAESPLSPSNAKAAPWLSVPGGAEAGMSDHKTVGSPRDFMARVEAARAASETDNGTGQQRSNNTAGNATVQPLIAAQVDADGSGLRAYAARRPAERFGQRSVAAAAAGATAGTEVVAPGTSHGASPVYSPGAATPVPATAVAEKLHHWVSRGVQNAQLQLDAFGGGAVDVSISVMGQETIVDFRTDNAQARSLLLDAMPQLKEMLEREGLVFSGGFVGESGQRGAGSQRRDENRHDEHAATVRTGQVMAAGMASSGRLPGAAGATIDLFV